MAGSLARRAHAQHAELVAAHPRDDIPFVHRRGEAKSHLGEQRVAARVPEDVVHPLEPVEVHEEERDALLPRAACVTAARAASSRERRFGRFVSRS